MLIVYNRLYMGDLLKGRLIVYNRLCIIIQYR